MKDTGKISLSVIEDNKVIRDNIIKYVEYMDDMTLVNSSGSVESFLHNLKNNPQFQSDIILLDIGLPGMSGLEGIPHIAGKLPDSNIVMLTTYEEEDKIVKALCSGAVGYISKKTRLADIMSAVRVVNMGGSYMSPSIAREIANHFVPKSNPEKSNVLTKRQSDILAMLVEGDSYASIAIKLVISVETVKSHIKKIYKALNVSNKAGAISKYHKGEA